jgi:trans-2,3-dihydro-3-hydroxyanthranilate isomerase
MAPRIYLVDVFTDQPYAGNPLAVVVGAETLPDQTMQKLASEINFSETVFIDAAREGNGGYRARMFTPAREIDFAGHAILGAAWVLRQCASLDADVRVPLDLAIGRVFVDFERNADGKEIAWFLAPSISLKAGCSREQIAAVLGLSPEDIDVTEGPIQIASAGTSALLIPLRDLDALRRSKPDLSVFADLASMGFPPLFYLFCRQTRHRNNDLSARFFFEAHGVREDPATGNGAAFLGAYILQHGLFSALRRPIRIEQGYEMLRPSLVLLRAEMIQRAQHVRVGGQVVATIRGELL